MIFIIFATLFILTVLVLVFRDSKIIRDLKAEYVRKTKPPNREPVNIKKSQLTTPYEFIYADPRNFSQPRDGKLDQYDFSLPTLPHRPSMYYSSNAFIANKRIIPTEPIDQPLADGSIVGNRRFYRQSRQKQNLSKQKKESAKHPSNQAIYDSSSRFYNNVFPTSYDQILSSAENPHVLPAVVKEKKVPVKPPTITTSSNSSANISRTSSGLSLPPPPSSISSGSAFNFPNFGKK